MSPRCHCHHQPSWAGRNLAALSPICNPGARLSPMVQDMPAPRWDWHWGVGTSQCRGFRAAVASLEGPRQRSPTEPAVCPAQICFVLLSPLTGRQLSYLESPFLPSHAYLLSVQLLPCKQQWHLGILEGHCVAGKAKRSHVPLQPLSRCSPFSFPVTELGRQAGPSVHLPRCLGCHHPAPTLLLPLHPPTLALSHQRVSLTY